MQFGVYKDCRISLPLTSVWCVSQSTWLFRAMFLTSAPGWRRQDGDTTRSVAASRDLHQPELWDDFGLPSFIPWQFVPGQGKPGFAVGELIRENFIQKSEASSSRVWFEFSAGQRGKFPVKAELWCWQLRQIQKFGEQVFFFLLLNYMKCRRPVNRVFLDCTFKYTVS